MVGVVHLPRVGASRGGPRALLLAFLLMVVTAPWVPTVDAAEGDLVVGPGETLVISSDHEVGGDVYVNGTLVIDGVEFKTYTGSWPDDTCNIFVYGTLRLVNGASLTGDFRIAMGPSGSLVVHDSEVSCRSSQMYCIDQSPGSVEAVNSTLSTNLVLMWCEGADVTLVNTTVEVAGLDAVTSAIYAQGGTDLLMDRVTLTAPSQGVTAWTGGNVTVRDCRFQTSGTYAVSLEDQTAVVVTGTTFRGGGEELLVTGASSVTVDGCIFEKAVGQACQVAWSGNVSVRGMSVRECADVALNVTNSTNVTILDLDAEGVTGDGIGLMSEHNEGLTARNVTVRYADKGVYMIHSDDVTLEDVNVDWCERYGLQLSHCDGVDVTRLSATYAGIDGLYAAYCKGLSVEDSDLDGADECGAFLTHTPTSMTRVTARSCGGYGVRAAVNSVFLVGCDLSYNGLDGFLSLDQGGAGLTNCTIEGNGGNGTRFVAAKGPFLKECRVTGNADAGILLHYETRAADVIDCDVEGNRWGIVLNGPTTLSQGSSVTARYTYIHNNTEGGALNWLVNSSNLDARWCWWGNNTGPYNATRNANGTGDYIEGGVMFIPWLKLGNLAPIITGPEDLEVTEEEVVLFTYDVDDLDDDPDRVTFGLQSAPGNVSIDPTSGILTVAPEDAEVGAHSFFVTATDERGGVGRLRVTLLVTNVNDKPQILVPEGGLTFGDDDSIEVRLRAYDPDSPVSRRSWYVIEGPEWLDLSAEGMLTGTTTWRERGSHSITVRLEDGDGEKTTVTIPIRVVAHYEPIVITGLNTTTAFEGRPYSAEVLITHDPAAELVWKYITNASWLALDAEDGRLVGTPALRHVGRYAVQLTVSDQFGQETTVDLVVEVVPFNDAPFWVGFPARVLVKTTSWDLDLSQYVSDQDDPVQTLSFSIDAGDPRLRIQGQFLTGTFARGEGDAVANVIVTDPHGASTQRQMRIVVDIPQEPEPAPTVSSIYPWVLVVVVAALVLAVILSRRQRNGQEGEGIA